MFWSKMQFQTNSLIKTYFFNFSFNVSSEIKKIISQISILIYKMQNKLENVLTAWLCVYQTHANFVTFKGLSSRSLGSGSHFRWRLLRPHL